jgi:RNA polymerase sigma factor (TIGR02999 family)
MAHQKDAVVRPAHHGRARLQALLASGVYEELRGLAKRYLADHRPAGVLQPTALVHEAFLKLANRPGAAFKSRSHFGAMAAAAMRQTLLDHLRGEGRAKRGGAWHRVTLATFADLDIDDVLDVIAVHEALQELTRLDQRAAHVVELKFFGGLTEVEIAEVLEVTDRTVRNDWRMARAWLRRRLSPSEGGRHEHDT